MRLIISPFEQNLLWDATNVEVTEPFWFRDDFNENSLGRYPKTQISTLTSTISDGEWHVSDCFDTTWTLIPTTLKRGAFNLKQI